MSYLFAAARALGLLWCFTGIATVLWVLLAWLFGESTDDTDAAESDDFARHADEAIAVTRDDMEAAREFYSREAFVLALDVMWAQRADEYEAQFGGAA